MRYDIMQYSTWVRSDAWRAAGCGDCTTRRNVGALGTAESRPGVSCAAAALADPPPLTNPPPPRHHFTFTLSARSIRHDKPFCFLTDFARGISNRLPY